MKAKAFGWVRVLISVEIEIDDEVNKKTHAEAALKNHMEQKYGLRPGDYELGVIDCFRKEA